MKQYPHNLYLKTVTGSSQDESGNFLPGNESWVFHSECREQTNGKGSLINAADGEAIVFASTVHLPMSAPRIAEGSEVKVLNGDPEDPYLRIQGTVLKFDPGRLHNRLWL